MNGNISRAIDNWAGQLICLILFVHSRLRALLGGPPQPSLHATTPPDRGRAPARPRRILCIKTYGLGNIAMLLPVLGAVKRAYPEAEMNFLTLGENRRLLEHSGLVENVISLSDRGWGAVATSCWSALQKIRSDEYDLVLDFEQFVKLSTIFAYMSGAPERIGFNTDGQRRGWLLTSRVVYSDSEHMGNIFMRLLRPLKIDTTKARVKFQYSDTELAKPAQLLAAHDIEPDAYPIIVMHVGSGPNFYRMPLKRWPTEKFAQLGDGLVEKYGAKLILTGKGEDEASLVRDTIAQMKHPVINACDELTIAELLVLLERCNLTVSNDTSVVHLSAVVGTPVAAFFGPTNPLQYGPGNADDLVIYKDLYCGPCLTNYNLKVSYCSEPVCIRSITVDEVIQSLDEKYLGPEATAARAVGNLAARPKAKLEVLEGSRA